jgi:hypothetical protein
MTQVRIVAIEEALLISKQGGRRTIRGSVAPVADDGGSVLGAVLVFHETASGERALQASGQQGDRLWKMDARLGRPQGLINLCSWCKLPRFAHCRSLPPCANFREGFKNA